MSCPSVKLAPLATMKLRSSIMAQLRAFFAARNFCEVDTPVILPAPAPEAAIDPVPVTVQLGAGAAPLAAYLQTSPELAMKRLVAHGMPRIYQVASVFRDGDMGPMHRPEFRLLEWYRSNVPYTALMQDCEALLGALAQHVAEALGDDPAANAHLSLLRPPYRRINVVDAVFTCTGLRLEALLEREALAAELAARQVHFAADDDWADLFHRVFVSQVEPQLLRDKRPFFLDHFPAPLASLAQLDPNNPAVAERFELYAGGVELANAFAELRCQKEQRRRFEAERTARQARAKTCAPLDERYLAALEDLPPTAGIALGIERLMAILLAADNLDAISFVPWRSS